MTHTTLNLFKELLLNGKVADLYLKKDEANKGELHQYQSISTYFTSLGDSARTYYKENAIASEFIMFFCDAVYLIEKHKIPPETKLTSLILDDDGYIESDRAARNIHHKLNFANIYLGSLS